MVEGEGDHLGEVLAFVQEAHFHEEVAHPVEEAAASAVLHFQEEDAAFANGLQLHGAIQGGEFVEVHGAWCW